jgi:hypothetical protein
MNAVVGAGRGDYGDADVLRAAEIMHDYDFDREDGKGGVTVYKQAVRILLERDPHFDDEE